MISLLGYIAFLAALMHVSGWCLKTYCRYNPNAPEPLEELFRCHRNMQRLDIAFYTAMVIGLGAFLCSLAS